MSSIAVAIFTVARETKEPEIKIVKETKTIYKIKKVPITAKDFINCFRSRIEISGAMRDNWIDITSSDLCKQSKKSFKLKAKRKNWGTVIGIQGGYGVNHQFQPSGYIGIGFTYGFIIY